MASPSAATSYEASTPGSSRYLKLHAISVAEPLPAPPIDAQLRLTLAFTPLVPLIDCQWHLAVTSQSQHAVEGARVRRVGHTASHSAL